MLALRYYDGHCRKPTVDQTDITHTSIPVVYILLICLSALDVIVQGHT